LRGRRHPGPGPGTRARIYAAAPRAPGECGFRVKRPPGSPSGVMSASRTRLRRRRWRRASTPRAEARNFHFASRNTESELHQHIQLVRGMKRERDGYFMRAESLYNVATQVDDLRVGGDGPRSLHAQSHGEAFLALALQRFRGNGLYTLDEPEAALSPQRQLSLLVIIDQLVRKQASQLIIATHSPILIAYPRARIYLLGAPSGAIETIRNEDTEHLPDHARLSHRPRGVPARPASVL